VILNLDERYRAKTDNGNMNWILEFHEDVRDKQTKKIKGREWKHLGYHGRHLNHAVKQYAGHYLMNFGEECDVNELLDKLKELEDHVDKVVKRQNITFELKKEEAENENLDS
jgi:hypothetical protein